MRKSPEPLAALNMRIAESTVKEFKEITADLGLIQARVIEKFLKEFNKKHKNRR